MSRDESLRRKRAKVVAPYRSAYLDALNLRAGDGVTIGRRKSEWVGWLWCTDISGRGGWIPEAYIERKGSRGKLLTDYDATELTVREGDMLEVLKEQSGWLWCKTGTGGHGWVPKENVELVDPMSHPGD